MRDIPVFTTDWGVASLGLREIPYRGQAYVHVQDVQPGHLDDLLKECIDFCRAAGAEQIFAGGSEALRTYPHHCTIYEMSGNPPAEQNIPASLWPVLPENVGMWRSIYNEKMKPVDHAATLSTFDEAKILNSGGAYFIHRERKLLGIGWMEENRILAIASCMPGQGLSVLYTLMSACPKEQYMLEVASTNTKAIRLYELARFLRVGIRENLYQIWSSEK